MATVSSGFKTAAATGVAALAAAAMTVAGLALPSGGGNISGDVTVTATKTIDGVDVGARDAVLTSTAAYAIAAVPNSLYDAESVLIAVADNTPVALPVGASTFVGRGAAGDVTALSAAAARTVLNVENAADNSATTIVAITAAETDYELPVAIAGGHPTTGSVWTVQLAADSRPNLSRTAALADHVYWHDTPQLVRQAANRGDKVTGAGMRYTTNTATCTEIELQVWTQTIGAVGGGADTWSQAAGTYDAASDTTVERVDITAPPTHHHLQLTVTTPAYASTFVRYWLVARVNGTATCAFSLKAWYLLVTRATIDSL